MKTSVIEVRGMLSVLSVLGVERRIGEVPGVESAVNFAAGSATVRYDETRLEIADIKSHVRRAGHESAGEPLPEQVSEHDPARERAVKSAPKAVPSPAPQPASAAFPLAAGVLYPFVLSPQVAALSMSMSGSTLIVALNALMLKRTKLAGIRQPDKKAPN